MSTYENWLAVVERDAERGLDIDLYAEEKRQAELAREAEAREEQEIEDELINLSLWADTVIEWANQVKQAAKVGERQRAWSAVEEIQCEAVEKMEDYPL